MSTAPAGTARAGTALAGTGTLVRLALRRDRLRLPVSVLVIVALLQTSISSVTAVYDTPEARRSYALVAENPVSVLLGGPGAGLPGLGAIVTSEIAVVGYVAVALLALLLVVRHTRAEEEAGRTELVRAGVVGRYAGPVAALLVVGAAVVAVGAITTAGLLGAGLEPAGSLALGASIATFGLVMAAVAAVAAQLTEHARGATGLASAALAVFFVVRAVGDVSGRAVTWASPMGWALGVRPFADERWAALLLPLLLTGALVAVTLVLVDRRDVGAGLLPSRPGRPGASRWLAGPFGLAVRQHRAAFAGWAAGLFLVGAAYGSLGREVEQLVRENEAMAQMVALGGTDVVAAYYALTAVVTALLATGFAVQVALRMRTEEAAGRLSPLLATALPRWRWAAGHLAVALGGSALLLAAVGLGTGGAHALVTGDPGQVARLTGSALVHAPAVWVVAGVAVALFGLLPRAAGAAWAVLGASAVLLLLGRALDLPQWALDLSPFAHVPAAPLDPVTAGPLLTLGAVAAALLATGIVGLQRRDAA